MSMLKEFGDFIKRGNVIDMAVGIVIGLAFGKIVTSFVNNIIMPIVGMVTGGVDFSDMKVILKGASVDAAGRPVPEVAIGYGIFINTIIEFLIIAAAVFLIIKAINTFYKSAAAGPSKQEQLLTEIRDLLKTK